MASSGQQDRDRFWEAFKPQAAVTASRLAKAVTIALRSSKRSKSAAIQKLNNKHHQVLL